MSKLPRAWVAAASVVVALLMAPRALTWWQHRILMGAAADIDLSPPCKQTDRTLRGEAFGIFATPPTVELEYECQTTTQQQTQALTDWALRSAGYVPFGGWRPENFTDTGPVIAATWESNSPGSKASSISVVIRDQTVSLTLGR